jgi:ubiquinol-cytochrome c reductase iron-sulfur subunit
LISAAIPGPSCSDASGGHGKSRIIDGFLRIGAGIRAEAPRIRDGGRGIGDEFVMADDTLDRGKRRFLVRATSYVGGVGVVCTATPFVMSLFPSERAKAAGAPVDIDIAKLEPGQKIDIEWRGKVVWVINRTAAMLATLPKLDPKLADPNSNVSQQPADCKNEHRSIKDDVLVMIGICTHLGCSPEFVPEIKPEPYDPEWKGGFYCPCHKSRYDIAGRVFQGVPAPANLVVPPYKFVNDKQILIGVGPEGAA